MKQRSSLAPTSFDRACRASKHFAGLFDRQTAEVSELNDAAEGFVEARQPLQRRVQGNDLVGTLDARNCHIVGGDELRAAAPLRGRAPARVIHGELSHGPGSQGKKMLTIVHREPRVLRELQVHLVNQDGGLQRLIAAVPEAMAGQRSQLLVDERHQLIDGLPIAAAPGGQQVGDGSRIGRHAVRSRTILRRSHAAC